MASRMESNSEIGRILISSVSYDLLNSRNANDFEMEKRGYINVKVKLFTFDFPCQGSFFREKESS